MKRNYIPVMLCSLLVPALNGCSQRERPKATQSPAEPAATGFTLPLDVSDATLAQVSPEQVAPLRRYLAASAGWKLTQLGGVTAAIRREPADESTPDAGKLRLSADGFYFKHQPWRRYRTVLRFGAEPLPVEPAWRGILTSATPGRLDIPLQVVPADLPDYRSYLVLSGRAPLALEVMEESMDTGRDTTRRLLREVSGELKKVLAVLPSLGGKDALPGFAPQESLRSGPPVLKVESAHQPGAFHVYGYVNPGQAGYVYARILDQAGKPLSADPVREQTLEYVGWSEQPSRVYFFNSQLRLPEGSPRPGAVELWFHPDQGAERKLLTARVG